MPRHFRVKSSTRTYHIVIKGADRQLLFEEKKDYIKYLKILEYFKQKCKFEIFAYCLMSNHVHLLIRHPVETSLETIFRRINTTYAIWFNMKYNRTGFVQNDRFFSEPVENTTYFLNVIRYIHYNPTKAGLEQSPGKAYPWSSYSEYLNRSTNLVDTDFALAILGGIDHFLDFHLCVPNDNCLDINQFRTRLPDDVAQEIIHDISHCATSTEFQKLSLIKRDEYIRSIHEKGVSIRQLNRLTGASRGTIQRILAQP